MVDSRATHAELIPTYAYLLIPKNLLANRRGRLNVLMVWEKGNHNIHYTLSADSCVEK